MAYSDFTLKRAETQFGLTTNGDEDYFAAVTPVVLSDLLRQTLDELAPLAIDIDTEKARSEYIIAPILAEVRRKSPTRISLFSGVEFNPDPDNELRGVCDFLLSLSPEQLVIKAPVVTIVEAKNDHIKSRWGQCVAEMVGAQFFNANENQPMHTLYGVVTTGTIWRFLRLREQTVYVDRTEYYLKDVEKIVGILLAMLQEAAANRP